MDTAVERGGQAGGQIDVTIGDDDDDGGGSDEGDDIKRIAGFDSVYSHAQWIII